MNDLLVRVLLAFFVGWIFGFGMTRSYFKNKYRPISQPEPQGILKLVYDPDDPMQPPMGLEIGSLEYLLTHDSVFLIVEKKGFPSTKRPVFLKSKDDKSA